MEGCREKVNKEEEGDGEELKHEVVVMDRNYNEERSKPLIPPRRVYVEKKDLEEHGYTARCPGCRSILMGDRARQGHSEECKQRLEKELERTLKARRAKMRKEDHVEKVMEEEEEREDEGR